MQKPMQKIKDQCEKAFNVYQLLASASTSQKNQALENMAAAILANQAQILSQNQLDLAAGKDNGLSEALLDRLALNESRLKVIADSFFVVRDSVDPIGEVLGGGVRPNGLRISKIRVPLGVIGIIYEARPNVTADAVALCLKSGNCVVLRGSSSAYNSNLAIANVLKQAISQAGLPSDAIQLLEDTSRENINQFLTLNQYLSVIIPRGGAGLIQTVVQNATVPTIETGTGNCHVYVDAAADLTKALPIIINSKTHRPSVCNAMETLLVHQDVAAAFLPEVIAQLQAKGVEIRACAKTQALVPGVKLANQEDWSCEFLDLILAVKIVASIDEALQHIAKYGTKHTESIVSENLAAVNLFKQQVDAAAVVVNASTRFTDGGEFGFGAEMGISTQKLHARGPMGLVELTSYKYFIEGEGQIRN